MKYLNIKLLHNPDGSLIYPSNYQVEIGNFAKDHLYYQDDVGNDYLLLLIEDADYKVSMVSENVVVKTETEAKAISEAKEVRTETITDEAKVRRIEIKSRLGMALTTDERKAIDPNDATPGFGVTKILADRVTDLKAIESAKKQIM